MSPSVRFTDEEPVYGQLFRLPDAFPLPDRLVHLAVPVMDYATGAFTGRYATCMGVLHNFAFPGWTIADWKQWRVPYDTPITCVYCLTNHSRLNT